MPEVAVVVVNFNAGEHLLRCLASVEAHTGAADVELVVVDNDSVDGSARSAAEAFPRATVIETGSNRGFAAGVNVGIAATTAPFILVLNPDAEIWEGTLEAFGTLAVERPSAGAIGPLIRSADGTIYPSPRVHPTIGVAVGHAFLGPVWPANPWSRRYRLADWDRSSEREVEWISGSAFLLRREALEAVGPLDERFFLYAEEVDLFRRFRQAGWRVLFTPELEILHEGGISTGRSRRMHLIHSQSVYRYFEKYHGRGWQRLLLPVAWIALRARAELVSLLDRVRAR